MESDKSICPNCKRKITEYGPTKLDGDYIGYPFDCSCGFMGTEWYSIIHQKTTKVFQKITKDQ
jgi:hypothetical protein